MNLINLARFNLEHWRRRYGHPELERLRKASLLSLNHRRDISKSSTCGCYFCLATFRPDDIRRWEDEEMGLGRTAVCPRCGMSAVLGDASGVKVDESFLREMRAEWYSGKKD